MILKPVYFDWGNLDGETRNISIRSWPGQAPNRSLCPAKSLLSWPTFVASSTGGSFEPGLPTTRHQHKTWVPCPNLLSPFGIIACTPLWSCLSCSHPIFSYSPFHPTSFLSFSSLPVCLCFTYSSLSSPLASLWLPQFFLLLSLSLLFLLPHLLSCHVSLFPPPPVFPHLLDMVFTLLLPHLILAPLNSSAR